MATGDFFELTHFQLLKGQQMLNVYHYEQVSGLAVGAAELLAAWQFLILPLVSALQADDVTYPRILVKNLNTETDNSEDLLPSPPNGSITDTPSPLRLAWAFRSQRPDLSKRYTWKRYGGIASGLLVGSIWNTVHASPTALEDALGQQLVGASNTYAPVQLRLKDPETGNPVLLRNYTISGAWEAIAEPATQDSRAFGRGS